MTERRPYTVGDFDRHSAENRERRRDEITRYAHDAGWTDEQLAERLAKLDEVGPFEQRVRERLEREPGQQEISLSLEKTYRRAYELESGGGRVYDLESGDET